MDGDLLSLDMVDLVFMVLMELEQVQTKLVGVQLLVEVELGKIQML